VATNASAPEKKICGRKRQDSGDGAKNRHTNWSAKAETKKMPRKTQIPRTGLKNKIKNRVHGGKKLVRRRGQSLTGGRRL